MNIGLIHSHTFAHDLNQWIPDMAWIVELEYTKHGNHRVIDAGCVGRSTNKFNGLVFNRKGECVSHPLSYRAINKGAKDRHYKITGPVVK